MAETFTSYSVDNDRIFREALARAKQYSNDLRIPLVSISKDFFKGQKAIWGNKGPGQYPDYGGFNWSKRLWKNGPTRRQAAKAERFRNLGFIYPMIKRSGALERSMTNGKDENAINEIINKKALNLGTKLEYGVFHQSDRPRKKLPLRKFLFIGPEAPKFANNDQMGRVQRWLDYIENHIVSEMERSGAAKKK